jgi:hypothetical protein
LKLGSFLGFYDILSETASFLFGLCQIVEQGAAVLRLNLCPGFGECCDRCIRFAVTALLNEKVLLRANKVLELGEVLEFRTKFLVSEVLANIDALLLQWNGCIKLSDRAVMVARSASFCTRWRSISASFAFCSVL